MQTSYAQQELMQKAGGTTLEIILEKNPDYIYPVVYGTGRTVYATLELQAKDKAKFKNLLVVCATEGSKQKARELGISTVNSKEEREIHEKGNYIYIDGTDQIVVATGVLIKGGNKEFGDPGLEGCMLKEKAWASRAGLFIATGDESKAVPFLGYKRYGLPVEFVPKYIDEVKTYLISKLGFKEDAILQRRNPPESIGYIKHGEWFVTENANNIFDIAFDGWKYNLKNLELGLTSCLHIKSTGLFAINRPNIAVIAYAASKLKPAYVDTVEYTP